MSLDMISFAFRDLGRYLISPKNGSDLFLMIFSNTESLITLEKDTASDVAKSICRLYCISLYNKIR